MPCSAPNVNISAGPSPIPIQGFGVPFSPATPSTVPSLPAGQPEDLNALFSALQFMVPPNTLKPSLHPGYDRTVLDGVMSLLNQFMPFLSLYNMFLPVLNLIICIIEVICAIPNPFKLIDKIQQLFRVCIPDFLKLFPQFALIIMILSIINLLISLIEYIITEVAALVAIIQQNIAVIQRALTLADDRSIAAATAKIGNTLCAFQNLFVLLSLFGSILSVIQAIIKLLFPIPPCSDSNGNPISCCSPDVCPSFIRDNTTITANTGTLQYYNEAGTSFLGLPFTFTERSESWQFYDPAATIPLAFINITQAYDLPPGTSAVFFPTDSTYTASTPPSQAPYLLNMRLFFNPTIWDVNNFGAARFIRINNCIITAAPTANISSYNNQPINTPTGVLLITGGLAFEDDDATPILVNGAQGTLNTLIHQNSNINIFPPPLQPTDGYLFSDISYTFTIQHPVLLGKALITLGCIPIVAVDRTFVNTIFGNNNNFAILNNLTLPDVNGTITCLSMAVTALQNNVNSQSLADFQATTNACLSDLRNQSVSNAIALINAGFDPYKSTFTLTPTTQFTTQAIAVSVSLVETTGASLTTNLTADVATTTASNIKATTTLGQLSDFTYDGSSAFTANLTSLTPGTGTIQIAYQNQTISTITLPVDLNQAPTAIPTVISYNFVYSPAPNGIRTPVGDTLGAPQLGSGDVANNTEI